MKETLVVIRSLIRAAERLSGIQFQSIFLMSDEPGAFAPEVTNYLSSTLASRPKVFYSDFVQEMFSNNTEYKERGHESLGVMQHNFMDQELAANIAFAAKHGSYLVGYGRSGVSQLIAQLLGSKYRMGPSHVSLFEDDLVLLQHLPETQDWYWLLEQQGKGDLNEVALKNETSKSNNTM
mmetsp:Transcript_29040/g.54560  ORF Transcript_29040/g.54560 Transcript_29040/m.54560 type:complete len:179 (+) Transcript_29040:432-968(+)